MRFFALWQKLQMKVNYQAIWWKQKCIMLLLIVHDLVCVSPWPSYKIYLYKFDLGLAKEADKNMG